MSAVEIADNPDTSVLKTGLAAFLPLRRLVATEALLGRKMARQRWASAPYEFLRFGVKQGWACLFGGIAVGLMILNLALLSRQRGACALRLSVPVDARCPGRAARKPA